PYLWLEALQSERALQWVAEQNERSTSALESTARFDRLARDAQAVLGGTAHLPLAEILGDHAYGFWQDERNPRGLWRRAPVASYLSGEPQWDTLLDLDDLATREGESWAWAGARCLEPANDRCLIGLSRGGIAAVIWREFSVSERAFVEGGFVLPEAQSNWIGELGDPDHPEEGAFLRSISPYHNVRAGKSYPPTLLVSSSMDDVVHAGHARKFVARLEEVGADVLYYEATEGGHGGTGLASGAAYEWALQYAFLHETLCGSPSAETASRGDGPAMQIDHVILATTDLESGMQEFEDLTGVRPVYGGSHPDRDTHNAIASLSGGMYVEILAPKDELDAMPAFFANFHHLTLVGFALSTRDIERVESTVRDLNLATKGTESGSRTTPDGGLLAWRLLLINEPASFMNPFFIAWSTDSQHPSKAQPPQAALESLILATPHKEQIERILSESGDTVRGLTIVEGERTLTLELETPRGRITFES
ncbi:MAG: VOC family protein, partial [Acidobacteriota bacterium]